MLPRHSLGFASVRASHEFLPKSIKSGSERSVRVVCTRAVSVWRPRDAHRLAAKTNDYDEGQRQAWPCDTTSSKICLTTKLGVLSKPVVPPSYTLLNLTDLRLGLEDLFAVRRGPLLSTHAGKNHEEGLAQQHSAIVALPRALTGGRPFAEEMALRHSEVDAFGMGLWYFTEAYLRVPGVDPSIVEAARRIRHALIPNTDRLRDAYPEQAAAAEVRKQNLATVADELARIPLAMGGTLYDWAMRFVDAGERIATTLAERAEINATTRKHAMTVLADTLRILNELRNEVSAEIAATIGMPREIEKEIFGYFDVLEATRVEAKRTLEQNQAQVEHLGIRDASGALLPKPLLGPASTRSLTPMPGMTRVIPGPPPSHSGYADSPASTRGIPPPPESPIPLSRISYLPPPPPTTNGPKDS